MVNLRDSGNPDGIRRKPYIIWFKKKDERVNKTDDKVAIFRSIVQRNDDNSVNISELGNNAPTQDLITNENVIREIDKYETAYIMTNLSEDEANRLRKDPNIFKVEEDQKVSLNAQIINWGIVEIKAIESWNTGYKKKGKGVKFGMIDSGVMAAHEDIKGNFKGGIDLTGTVGAGKPVLSEPHGTMVGSHVFCMDNSIGVVGIVPEVGIYDLNVFGDGTGGQVSFLISAYEWALNNGMDVLNASLGRGGGEITSELNMLAQLDKTKKIIFCASAGNSGKYEANYPAAYKLPMMVSSAALTPKLIRSDYSTFHETVKFASPADDMNVCFPDGGYRFLPGGGTSTASPFTAGVMCAGMANWKRDPCVSEFNDPAGKAASIIKMAIRTARKVALQTDWNQYYGHGMPQADKLVTLMHQLSENI